MIRLIFQCWKLNELIPRQTMVRKYVLFIGLVMVVIVSCSKSHYQLSEVGEELDRLDRHLSGIRYSELIDVPYDSLSMDNIERYIPNYYKMEDCFKSLLRSRPREEDKAQLWRLYQEFDKNYNAYIRRYRTNYEPCEKLRYIVKSQSFHFAMEELMYFWNNEYYALRDKKEIRSIIEDYVSYNNYLFVSRKSRTSPCVYEEFGDIDKVLSGLRKKLRINESYPTEKYGSRYMAVNRFLLFEDVLIELINEHFDAYNESEDKSDSDDCRYSYSRRTFLSYVKILAAMFKEYENPDVAHAFYALYEKLCGGYHASGYFAKYHFPEYNEKLYDLCIHGKCAKSDSYFDFMVLLSTRNEENKKQYKELYLADLKKISTMSVGQRKKVVNAYRFFDNFLDGDTLVYNRLKRSKVEEELLLRFREKYLDNFRRQSFKKKYGKYSKGQ